jgi:hypothetical protein
MMTNWLDEACGKADDLLPVLLHLGNVLAGWKQEQQAEVAQGIRLVAPSVLGRRCRDIESSSWTAVQSRDPK